MLRAVLMNYMRVYLVRHVRDILLLFRSHILQAQYPDLLSYSDDQICLSNSEEISTL